MEDSLISLNNFKSENFSSKIFLNLEPVICGPEDTSSATFWGHFVQAVHNEVDVNNETSAGKADKKNRHEEIQEKKREDET